jgi:hypothetical protein
MTTDKAADKAPSTPPNATGNCAAETIKPDWKAIELDYRAGIKTLRQMADEQGISHAYIAKRAKTYGWERDLSAKIQAKAEQLVTKAAVTNVVTTETRVSERDIVDANADAIAGIRLAHRRDIQRSRSVVIALLSELELQTGQENVDLLEQLGELLRKEDENGQDRLNDLYHKIISLPGRAKTMKDLGESLRVLVAMERQAFGMIDDKDGGAVLPLSKELTDTERAVRLARLLSTNPDALAAFTGAISK